MSLGGGYLLRSREGHAIAAIGLGITMKTDGKSTHDAYSLFEYSVPARVDGPPPHLHTREDESFICLSGRLDVHPRRRGLHPRAPATTSTCRATSCTPSATPTTRSRGSSRSSRRPGSRRYYQALAEMPPGPKDVRLLKKIMEDFGIQLQLPPEVR